MQSLFPQEVTMIQQYLDNGGKALSMIDPQTDPKLDPVFTEWSISAPANIVVDASGVGRMFGLGPAAPLVVDYGTSPITKGFQGCHDVFSAGADCLDCGPVQSDISSVELLKTSAGQFRREENHRELEVKFDPATDLRGPLSLGVSAEKKTGDKDTRLVVIGNSTFATDQWGKLQRNGDLFFNAVNWLAQDENLISIRPKNPENRQVTLSEAQQRGLQWFSVILLPGLVILAGVWIWWKRR